MVAARVEVERTFRLAAAPDAAWALLADVPRWGALFPRVAAVGPFPAAGPDAYRWTMEPMGPPGVQVRTEYACRYSRQPDAGVLTWAPVEGVGNARFEGAARVGPGADGGTDGALRLLATLQIPAPRFARGVVEPAVALEMGRMTDRFLARLDEALGTGST